MTPEALTAAALADSEERLRLATDHAEVGFWDVEEGHGTLTWPPRVKAMFGISADRPVSMDDFYAGLHPDDRSAVADAYAAAADPARRALYDVEYRTIGKEDGLLRWVAAKGRGVFDGDGADARCLRVIGTTIEVTRRKQAEAALAASEEFSRRVLAASADCIKVLDLDARLEFMSEGGMCVMEVDDFGTIEGACWPDFWPGEGNALALAAVEAARGGGTGRFQGPAPTAKGTPRWWDVIVSPINGLDGRPERLLSISRDVTATKEAEEALRRLNETLEAQVAERTAERDRAWRLSRDLQAVVEPDGTFRSVNPAWLALMGYDPSALIGRRFLDLLHPDDVAASLAAMPDALAGRVPSFENRYLDADGRTRSISWTVGLEGGVIYASGRDVTAEREREAELALAQEALRQAQKMEAVGQLTGGLAHDFNNLLAGISGSLEMMGNRIAQGRLVDVDRYMVAAQGAARRAAALTHRLLAFSRRQTLEPKPTDVNRLVADMEELIRRTVGPEVEVEAVAKAGLWTTLVDPHQLENALLNLCINARDAMPDGGRITVETGNRWLDERAARERDIPPGQYVSLCVSDNGTGMSADVAARAFDPFFTTKPLGEGTGLGLSMIYGFARQSGGQVRIYSEVGQGTMVCLYLPRHHGSGAMDDPSSDASEDGIESIGAGETVLVIDDEPTVRMLVVDVVEELGFRAVEAGTGPEGLEVLRSNARVDLLVTDVGLPGGLNGRQVADAARTLRPGLKVLFITGYAENAVLSHGHLDPGMAVVTKPFDMARLAARIREMIAER